MSNPLPVPPSNDTPGGLIKSTDVSTLYNLLAGATTNSISIDGAITASDVITANGGLTVPSGQTATVAGTLDVTGAATVPAATAPEQPVNQGQVANGNIPPVATGYNSSTTQVSATSGSFTAPSNGNLMIFGLGYLNVNNPSNIAITATLAGLVVQQIGNGVWVGYLPMTAGQITTLTGVCPPTSGSTNAYGINFWSIFVPTP